MGIESPKAESRDVPKKDFFNQPQVKKLEEIRDETNHVKQFLGRTCLGGRISNRSTHCSCYLGLYFKNYGDI